MREEEVRSFCALGMVSGDSLICALEMKNEKNNCVDCWDVF